MLTVMLEFSGGPVILLWVSQGSYEIVYSSNLENKKVLPSIVLLFQRCSFRLRDRGEEGVVPGRIESS